MGIIIPCPSCRRPTDHARDFGWRTLVAVILTAGLWLLVLPFYKKRCMVCGLEASGR